MSLVLVSREDRVGIVHLNRPHSRNALTAEFIEQLLAALKSHDDDPEVGAIVLTGSDTVFCAGADIKEISQLTFVTAYMGKFLQSLNNGIAAIRKPVIAAVRGYALGGGCELAMMCDIIYAGVSARFGQPEVKIGTIPGAGGTQRLLRAVGKAKAMHLVLTGDTISASEAEAAGLVAYVFPDEKVVEEAISVGNCIGKLSVPVIAMAKEAVNKAEESGLREGLAFESRLYHATYGMNDSHEGFNAFLEKRREPQWTNS